MFLPCLPTDFGGYVLPKVFLFSSKFCRPTLVVPFLPTFSGHFWTFFRQACNPGVWKQKVFSSLFADRLWWLRSCQSVFVSMRVLLTDFGCFFLGKVCRPFLDRFVKHPTRRLETRGVFIQVLPTDFGCSVLANVFLLFWKFFSSSIQHDVSKQKVLSSLCANRLSWLRSCQSLSVIMRVLPSSPSQTSRGTYASMVGSRARTRPRARPWWQAFV